MKLPKVNALMAILAIETDSKDLKNLLAISDFTAKEKEDVKSSIGFYLLLKKQLGDNISFITMVKRLLLICKCQDLLKKVDDFDEKNPGWPSESLPPIRDRIPSCITASHVDQSQPCRLSHYRTVLFKISQAIHSKDLEKLVGVCPIPESSKEGISRGCDLFDTMEKHGCINENDTELLQEMLELLQLSQPLTLLYEYQRKVLLCLSTHISLQVEDYSASKQQTETSNTVPSLPLPETVGHGPSKTPHNSDLLLSSLGSISRRLVSTFTFPLPLCSSIMTHHHRSSDQLDAEPSSDPHSGILIPVSNDVSTLADHSQATSCELYPGPGPWPITCECSQEREGVNNSDRKRTRSHFIIDDYDCNVSPPKKPVTETKSFHSEQDHCSPS